MKSKLDWDDLRLFLHVARLGGLSAAASVAGVSAATLGRRLAAFEDRIGEPLFHRKQSGYQLTGAGEELLVYAEQVEEAVRQVTNWRDGIAPERVVRISAGTWTSWFLSRNIAHIWTSADPFRVELVTAYTKVDIGRHNADMGIRSERPTEQALVARRLCDVAYCLYCSKEVAGADPLSRPAIAVTGEGAGLRSARWLTGHFGDRVALRGNDARSVLDLVAAGAGFSVFPCFVGDDHSGLTRIGSPISELLAEQWVVSHAEIRQVASIRRVASRIASLIRSRRTLFSAGGRRT